jgi:uncharacterized protein (DUF2141 family)
MNRTSWITAAAFVSSVLFAQPPSGQGISLRIKVTGIKAGTGTLQVAVYDKPKGFPTQYMNASYKTIVTSPGPEAEVVFDSVVPGRYAVSVMQDLNGNGKLDTWPMGIPKEPWGVSNNIKAKLGPPSFESALISIRNPVSIEIAIAVGTHW